MVRHLGLHGHGRRDSHLRSEKDERYRRFRKLGARHAQNHGFAEVKMLFFVVRIDVTADSGQQRCFGVFDTVDDAQKLIVELSRHMRGEFDVFEGKSLELVGTNPGAK
jgi:hypothetical protein